MTSFFNFKQYLLVVRAGSPEMGGTIHGPGEVQATNVTEQALLGEGQGPGLAKEVDRHRRWQDEAE